METIIAVLAVVAVLGLFDLTAFRVGADSRDQIGDAHRRSSEGGH